jgi:hypothetical protein
MNSLFTRKAVEFYSGRPAPPTLAYVEMDHQGRRIITWDQVMKARRERQTRRLSYIREANPERAYRICVSYFDQWIMGGWQTMLDDWRGRDYAIWIDRDRQWFKAKLMRCFPLVLALGSEESQWREWKEAFAKQYERRRQDREPVGVAYIWWDGHHGEPRPISPPGGRIRPIQTHKRGLRGG